MYLRFATRPTASGSLLGVVRDTSSVVPAAGNIVMAMDGTLQVGGTNIGILSPNTWYHVEMLFTRGTTTSNGAISVRVYIGSDTTPTYSSDVTTANLGTANLGQVRFGKISSGYAMDAYMDEVAYNDGATAFIGPAGSNVPPTASAGSPQHVQRGASVTVTGADADSDGTVASRQWTVTASPGTAPTLTGATTASASFTAATAGRYVLQYVVTDNIGATSAPSTVTVYAYPQTGEDVTVYSDTAGSWTKFGGAASTLVSVNDVDATTGVLSPTNPSGQPYAATLNPIGPGDIKLYLAGRWIDAATTRTITLYKEDGTTVVDTWTQAPTNSDAEVELVVDAAGLAAVPNIADRRALVLKIQASVA